ncbi:MAG: cyclic nucleotide-binding domain-containing protein [Chloroflexi bacterium]|nr:MAG: cyclic nucleotide-binding domain-containing protein [Chloroflexota bacterium]
MISPELIRRYPFSAGLTEEELILLAKSANEETVEAGTYFFKEGDELNALYLVIEGAAAVVIEVPDHEADQSVAGQLTGQIKTRDVVISAIGPGDVFAPSSLIPPHVASASVKATTDCRVIKFDAVQLRQVFEENCHFGYRMVQKAAAVIRERLQAMRIESLAHLV